MTMSKPMIELVQLKNGDIVLRHSDEPDLAIVTISFSDALASMMPGDRMDISKAMVEAGIERFQQIQFDRAEQTHAVSESGLLH